MQKTYLKIKKGTLLRKHDPFKNLLDKEFIARAIQQCLGERDFEGIAEVVQSHFWAMAVAKRQGML